MYRGWCLDFSPAEGGNWWNSERMGPTPKNFQRKTVKVLGGGITILVSFVMSETDLKTLLVAAAWKPKKKEKKRKNTAATRDRPATHVIGRLTAHPFALLYTCGALQAPRQNPISQSQTAT